MPDKPWSLRYFRPGDEEGMLDCIAAAFGPWPAIELQVSPLDHLVWKLGDEINGRRYHIIAEAAGRIIACGLVRPCRFKLDGRVVDACFYGDMAVRPEYQNLGMMGEVWDHQVEVAELFAFSIGISGNRFVHNEDEKRPRNRPLANDIAVFEKETAPAPGGDAGLDVRTARQFDGGVDALWAEASRAFRFAMVRDQTWLNYRYGDARAGRFTIRTAYAGDELAGYAVLTNRRGKGFIAGLLALPGRRDALDALLRDAQRHFAGAGVERLRCWLPGHHPYREAVLGSGFVHVRDVGRLIIGRFGGTDVGFLAEDAEAAIHYTAGDTDVV